MSFEVAIPHDVWANLRRMQEAYEAEHCPCICHDMGGGPAHPNQKCQCNGGEGMDA